MVGEDKSFRIIFKPNAKDTTSCALGDSNIVKVFLLGLTWGRFENFRPDFMILKLARLMTVEKLQLQQTLCLDIVTVLHFGGWFSSEGYNVSIFFIFIFVSSFKSYIRFWTVLLRMII